jgi:N6-adenosine-specific RNA methylase IME4
MSQQLTSYDAARLAVQRANTPEEAKDIADKSAALQDYARRAHDPELERWVAEIRLRAKRRLGEISRGLDKAPGERTDIEPLPNAGKRLKAAVLKAAGVSTSEAQRCERLAEDVSDADFEAFIAEHREKAQVITGEAAAKLLAKRARKDAVVQVANAGQADCCTVADLHELVSRGRKFGAIYADPPWVYDNQGTRAATTDHYVGLTVDQLCDPAVMPVRELAADDAHLHLWTTNAFLFDAPRIFAAWGFEFRSAFVWVKPQIGIGNYWRNSHEYLLTAIRGNAKRFNDRSLRSWGEFDRRQHSAKPEELRTAIERASTGPYLELFGRRRAPGWTVWGNEIKRDLLFSEAA